MEPCSVNLFVDTPLKSGVFVHLTDWLGFQFNTMLIKTGVSSLYAARVQIPSNRVMRIENAKFEDEGTGLFLFTSHV